MSDTKLDPRSLSSAVVREVFPPPPPLAGWVGFYWDSGFYDSEQGTNEDAGWYCSGKVHATREDALCELAGFRPFEGSALVEVGSALFGEPASGGGKVECPNCGGEAAYFDEHHDGYEFLCAPCKPAQPEPAKQDFGSLLDAQQRYVAEHRAQPAPAANSAQAINARAEAAFAEATRLKPVADGRNLVTAETHPDLFPWVKPHAPMRDEAVAEAINTEPVAAVYIDSPGGQRNRVLTDETDKPVAAEMPRKLCYTDVAPVSTEQAIAAAKRLIDAAFGNKGEKPRFSIPVDLTRDDDVLLMAFIEQRSQPAPAVAMTEELSHVLAVCDDEIAEARRHASSSPPSKAARYNGEADAIAASVAAVRLQAAEAGKVTLLQVRIALDTMRAHFEPDCQGGCQFPMVWDICRAALAELDAAEGRK